MIDTNSRSNLKTSFISDAELKTSAEAQFCDKIARKMPKNAKANVRCRLFHFAVVTTAILASRFYSFFMLFHKSVAKVLVVKPNTQISSAK
jgi:hypothetical protein